MLGSDPNSDDYRPSRDNLIGVWIVFDPQPHDSILVSNRLSAVNIVVTIATSGRPDLLNRTLKSLGECQLPAEYGETVIIENGTRAGADEVVRSARAELKARYMHIDIGNKSAALNAALETVGDCLMFFTDDDVRLAPSTLAAYVQTEQQRGPGHFYGGPMNVDYDVPPPEWLREYLPNSATGWELSEEDQRKESMEFLGCNWAAYARDLRAAGGFNVNHGPGSPTGSTGQETEMQRRLLRMGLGAVYVPGSRVWHYVPENRCTPAWVIERNYRNGVQDGALARGGPPTSWSLPPWWITSRYLKGIVRGWMWSLSSKPELRFKAKNRRSYDRGLMWGIRSKNGTAKTPPNQR